MEKGAKIVGTAHYVPKNVVTNEELSNILDTNDEWIQSHTGIKERRISLDGENTSDLATNAAQKLIEENNINPEDIDLIILSTITPDSLTPATAAIVQKNIKAKNAWAYDISTACAGFIFALSTADKFLKAGGYKNALIISSEVNSKMMDFKDRTSTVFFGDGAGALLLTFSENENNILSEKISTNGDRDTIHSGRVNPLTKLSENNFPKIDAFYQNGREVFKFATNTIPLHIKNFLEAEGVDINDIDYFILHQANLRIIEEIANKLGQPMEKFPHNVDFYGNTSSAGIPMVFDNLKRNKDLKGKKVLLTGFGAGISYGSILLDL